MNFRLPGLFVLPLIASALLTGCGGPDPKEEAKESFDVIFDNLKRSDIEGALMLYSPSFFKSTSRQEWLEQLRKIHASFGPVVSYEILSSMSEKRKVPIPGTYVGFNCKVNYQRGGTYLMENIVLVRPEGLQSFTISGHSITQPGPRTPQQAPLQQPQQPQAQPPQQQPPLPQPGQPQQPQAPPAPGTPVPSTPPPPSEPPAAPTIPGGANPAESAPPSGPDAGTTSLDPAAPGKTQ